MTNWSSARNSFGWCTLLIVSLVLLAYRPLAQQKEQQPTFQSRTVLVPIDVRVLDRRGKPVTDLGRDDFEVFEDGVQQQITLFEHVKREPIALDSPNEVRPEDRRAFLILMPRIWLTSELFGTTEAFTRFIRQQLLPQDLVAFCAWGRTTPLTTNHEEVAQVIERLRAYQGTVKAGPDRTAKVRDLYAAAVGRERAVATANELDAIFEMAGERARTNGRARVADVINIIEPLQDRADTLQRQMSGHVGGSTISDAVTARVLDVAGAVFYLRRFPGEKHLIYASPGGLRLPGVEDDRNVARMASDSRVVLHVVQTAGIGGRGPFSPHSTPGPVALFDRMSSQNTAELTGGRAHFYRYPSEAITEIDAATRSTYLLGFYPANPLQDGRHRKLMVRLKRPGGATLLFRRSYRALSDATAYDASPLVAQDRIMAAAEQGREYKDVPVTLTVSPAAKSVSAVAQLDLRQVRLADLDGRRTGTVHVAFFCTDMRQRLVGEFWQEIDLKLRPETYERTMADGLRHTANIPVSARPGYCKVVVYDPESDRVGSAITKLK